MRYRVEFSGAARRQLLGLTASQPATVLDAIEAQLTGEPLTETRNRKPLRPNPIAPWELRSGEIRIFYEVPQDEPDVVSILGIGIKEGNSLFIDGKEVRL